MASRPSRAIPIPPSRSSRRRQCEPSFPGPGVDPLAVPQTQPSFPSRSEYSHAYHGESVSGSLIFTMDPEPPSSRYSVPNAHPSVYDLPRFARPRTPGSPQCCRRCGRQYYKTAAHNTYSEDYYPVCPDCQGQAAPHPPTRPRANTMLATDYIPAWHRTATYPADVLQQPSPSSAAPPRPLHHYQQWHGMTAPAPHRPVTAASASHIPMLPAVQPHAGTTLPLPPPPPSSYLLSRLREQMQQAEEQFGAPTNAAGRSRNAVPRASQSESQSVGQGRSAGRRAR